MITIQNGRQLVHIDQFQHKRGFISLMRESTSSLG